MSDKEKYIIYPEDTLLEELYAEFSARTFNVLFGYGKEEGKTVRDLCNMTSHELREKNNVGFKTLMEVREFLRKQNRSLKDDILVSKEEEVKLILSIPETLKSMENGIWEMSRKLKNLENDLHSIRASSDPNYR